MCVRRLVDLDFNNDGGTALDHPAGSASSSRCGCLPALPTTVPGAAPGLVQRPVPLWRRAHFAVRRSSTPLGECHRIDWVVYAKRPAAIPVSPSLTDGWASFRATLNTIDPTAIGQLYHEADVYLLPLAQSKRLSWQWSEKCQRKLTRKLPSITRTRRRRIVRLRSITERANTIRASRSRRRLTNIQPRLIATQPPPMGRAANTGRRNSPSLPGQRCPGLSGAGLLGQTGLSCLPAHCRHCRKPHLIPL
jgi:hypothetical protein